MIDTEEIKVLRHIYSPEWQKLNREHSRMIAEKIIMELFENALNSST
jgi:hypothetical protein